MSAFELKFPSKPAQLQRQKLDLLKVKLAAGLEEAEALANCGKAKEAAELSAQVLQEARSAYASEMGGFPASSSAPMPTMPLPRKEYVARYIASQQRVEVDWGKWERCSRRALPAEPSGEGDGDEDDSAEDGDEDGAHAEEVPDRAAAAAPHASRGLNKTVTTVGGGGAAAQTRVDVVHTCGNGTKVPFTWIIPPVPQKAAHLFNKEPKATVKALREGDPELCDRAFSVEELALWLLGSDRLSKAKIGDYLGRTDEIALSVFDAFVANVDFTAFTFDEALRFFLSLFRLPGEAQMIDRIMQKFAARYTEGHPDTFTSPDTAYILAFSIIMLNTDAHSDAIATERKMTLEQFLRNNRGIGDGGTDLPVELLTGLYKSVVTDEIRMEQREFITSVKEGWLYKQGGRVKTWKRRYTILSGNVLYYFKSPKDKSPAGMVPLEGIEVRSVSRPVGSLGGPPGGFHAFEITQVGENIMKSVRTDKKNAGFKHGHHKAIITKRNPLQAFLFQAETVAEKEDWMAAVEQHAVKGMAESIRATMSGQSARFD